MFRSCQGEKFYGYRTDWNLSDKKNDFYSYLFVILHTFSPVLASFFREFMQKLMKLMSVLFLASRLLLVTLPDASTFVDFPIVASIPAFVGLPFSVYDCDVPIVSVAVYPTFTNFPVVNTCFCYCRWCCWHPCCICFWLLYCCWLSYWVWRSCCYWNPRCSYWPCCCCHPSCSWLCPCCS